MDLKRSVNGKLLRCGYTTGSCAAAAAKAAAMMLFTGGPIAIVTLPTPKGVLLALDVLDIQISPRSVRCAVRKDSGDDPDVTNGMLVYAEVEKIDRDIRIGGGEGVGSVTKPGLDQPVGAAAINSVPRRMITEAVQRVCQEYGYEGGLAIRLSIPGGAALARRTFNPRMGIEGGLSIIGTTGIVEPMSNAALVDTIRLELKQMAASGAKGVLLTPGNYGEAFAREKLGLSLNSHISCANFIGDAIDAAVELGFGQILLIGHIGKLVKLGIGMTNTHSTQGDGRMETLLACALQAGAGLELLRGLIGCVTMDAALAMVWEAGLLRETMAVLGPRIDDCLQRRVPPGVEVGYICFTNEQNFTGILARSANAEALIENWRDKG
ncbi:MAG: cobalt-precorrin-5B (C(1))-methyltransferase CbiD [Candidatus Pelethousia sp.]|nr:cobalt-precorrin-5B (C(1))-methyltransferase CbiD [Candidatus Pelethousia sp.]